MKFVRFLLFCFLALCLMCFTAILLLPKIKERNFIRLPTKTFSRYAEFLTAKFSQSNGPERVLVESDASRKSNLNEVPRRTEADLNYFLAVDREFEELLEDAKQQDEEEDDEPLEEEEEKHEQEQETSTEATVSQYDELSCKPHNNIAFLKTHKTGSSTLTNILNRYADLRELKVALPKQALYRFGWPGYFHWNNVDLRILNGEPANVLCNHARYRRPAMEVVMHSDTKYITILRDPVYQFESTFNYMELYCFFKLRNHSNPLEVFLGNPRGYLANLTRTVKPFPESMHLVRNGMFFDLGLSPFMQDKDSDIRDAIKNIESEFALVLIMEYFDESLVLLKREFCWDLDDVIYIKQNARKPGNDTSKRVLSAQLKDKIRDWNRADVLLYEHFNKTFWEKIKQHGPDFHKDLAELKRKNREMYNDCVSPEEVTEIAFRLTGKIQGFKLNEGVSAFNKYLCQKMLTNEIDYINYFRKKLHPYSEYQKQLRAASKAPQLVQGSENVIANRIKAMSPSQRARAVYGRVQPQAIPQRPHGIPQIPQRQQAVPQIPQAIPQRQQVFPQIPQAIPQIPQAVPQRPQVVPQIPQAVPQRGQVAPQRSQFAPKSLSSIKQAVLPQRSSSLTPKP